MIQCLQQLKLQWGELNQDQQFADIGEPNNESIQSDNQSTDTWVGHKMRAGRKNKKPARPKDLIMQ